MVTALITLLAQGDRVQSATERTNMKHTNNELEPPRKVGRGTPAVETCGNTVSQDGVNDDDSSLNLTWREKSDDQQRVQAMLKPKKSIKISTFNARTLREDWRLEERGRNNFRKEERLPSDNISSMEKQSTSSNVLSKKAENALFKVEAISPRVMTATFAGNPETTIIVAYSPTNITTNNVEVEEFYEHLRKAIDDTPPHHFLVIRRYECKNKCSTCEVCL